jgi:subtilase family serine protease
MLQHSRFALLSLVLLGSLWAWQPAALGQAVPLILSPVDESQRVVLRGNTRPDAIPANDRGAVDNSFPLNGIELLLKRSPEHEQGAAALADELQRRGSPQFHKWLTADQYAAQFGVHPQDVAVITDWLHSHGFSIDSIGPNRMTILFSGTAGQVKQAFGTEIHVLEVNGQRHIANMSDPSVPAALAPAIQGIVSLNDFRPKPAVLPKSQFTVTLGTYGTFYAVVPADLATIYNFNPLFGAGITGQGQTIVLIEDTDLYNPNDWQTFRKTFGLDAYKGASLETVHPGFGCPDPGVNADDSEAALDVEWASAAAPSAKIELASCADTTTTFGGLIAMQNLLNQPYLPSTISVSYSECEVGDGAAGNEAFRDVYQQGVLEGVSVFVSAGDEGAASCDADEPIAVSGVAVSGLASTVYNVAVGGTDFGDLYEALEGGAPQSTYWSSTNGPTFGSAKSYIPEIPWNDSCASSLIDTVEGFATGYGANGFCANPAGADYITTSAGSGGPSNCATGESLLGNIPSTYTGPTPTDGTCRGWKKPAWQSVLGNPNDGVRDLPDVSLFASNGVWGHLYFICNTDPETGGPCTGAPANWSLNNVGGGTSFASPIMAGIQALVNQVWGPQGNPAPVYYALANQEYGNTGDASCETFAAHGPAPTCVFHDVTIGDNDVDCTGPYGCFDPDASQSVPGVLSLSDFSYQPAYKAGPGWDFATGLGTVNATNLVLNPIWLFGAFFD